MRDLLALIERKTGLIIGAGAGSLATVQWTAIETGSKAILALCTALLAGTALIQKWRGRSSRRLPVKPVRILMVDDSVDDADLFSRSFKRNHCEVTPVHSHAAAISELRSERRYDLVLLDARMPGEDPVILYKQIRNERPRVTVAIFGSVIESSLVESISRFGFALFVRKPTAGVGEFVEELISAFRVRS
jgi:CheY-like chemotaxis protein